MTDKLAQEALPIIAKYYPFSLQEIKTLYDECPSFDYIIDICEHAQAGGFGTLERAERDLFGDDVNEQFEDSIGRQEMEKAFREVEVKIQHDKITDLAMKGLLVDGWFHKQWYLEQILKVLEVDFVGNYKRGIAP